MTTLARPFLKTVARRLYLTGQGHDLRAMRVHVLETGELLNADTFEPWEPDASWFHAESDLAPATFVLLLKWSDPKTGEECIALCGSVAEVREFAAGHDIGHYLQQIVKLVE